MLSQYKLKHASNQDTWDNFKLNLAELSHPTIIITYLMFMVYYHIRCACSVAMAHTAEDEKSQLHALLCKYEHLFDGTLGTWNNKPYNIELKEGAKPYHSRPFPVQKIHERTLKVK